LSHTHLDAMIARYLLVYKTTPHATTREVPSALLMGRRLCTRFDLMVPSLTAHVQSKQIAMQDAAKSHGSRQFAVNDRVLARNFSGLNKWEQGTVVEKLSNRYYMLWVHGTVVKRHVDQIIALPKLDYSSQLSVSDDVVDSASSARDCSVLPNDVEVDLPITTATATVTDNND